MSNYSLLCDLSKGSGSVELTAVRLSDGHVMGQLWNDSARSIADMIGGPRRGWLSTTANIYTDVSVTFANNGGNSVKAFVTRIADSFDLGTLTGDAAGDLKLLLAA